LANERSLKMTVGHDAQFNHAARRMRTLVHSGFLGDGPVHMESYYCYEFGQAYARALLGDTRHWVRRLPGKLLHNVISHGIARIAEFLTNDLHMKSGMRYLIQSFYDSIIENAPVPIPYREILLTARIMDAIFVQLGVKQSDVERHGQRSLGHVLTT